jgi:hypothetical protein
VFPLQRIEGWGFDPEILYLARKFGCQVVEVPVRWGHDTRTRINPLVDGLRMVSDMLLIRWFSMTGKYDRNKIPVPSAEPQRNPSAADMKTAP